MSTGDKLVEGLNNLPTSQLLMWCCVYLNIEGLLTFLPQRDAGQLLASIGLITFGVKVEGTEKLLEVEGSPLNKL
jgi:hypothetical protein